jgi:hypothetical protein
MSLDQLRFESIPAAVVESSVFDQICPPVDGLLGTRGFSSSLAIFDLATVEIDRDSSKLRLDRGVPPVSEADAVLPLIQHTVLETGEKGYTTALFVPLVLDGQFLWAVLDTGGAGLSQMSVEMFHRLGGSLEDERVLEYVGSHSASVASSAPSKRSWIVEFDQMELGPLLISNVPFRIVESAGDTPATISLHEDIVGMFNMMLDLRRAEMRLSVRERPPSRARLPTQLRLQLLERRIVVVGILKDGVAQRAGVEFGDELVELDDVVIDPDDPNSVCAARLWPTESTEDTRMLIRRDGELIEVLVPAYEDQ